MNTQIVHLIVTETLLFTDDDYLYYACDADVSPADYVKDSVLKACFAVLEDRRDPEGFFVETFPIGITTVIGRATRIDSGEMPFSRIYEKPGSDFEIATNNKWYWRTDKEPKE